MKRNILHLNKFFGYVTFFIVLSLLFFFLVLPVGLIMSKSFYNNGTFTLEYFKLLFTSSLYTDSMTNSLFIGLMTVIFTSLLTIPLAVINVKYRYLGKTFFSALLLTPLIMPPFVGAIGFQRIFAKMGTINLWLLNSGIIETPIDWLSETRAIWAVIILEIFHLYPIMYLNLSAALANVDPSMEEMAYMSGSSRLRTFIDIVWPLTRPGFFSGAIIVFIWAFTDLGTPLLVGFHQSIPVRIFNMVTDMNENPVGFALVFVVILLSVAIFILSRHFFGGNKYQMLARGHVSDTSIKATGLQTVVVCGFMSMIIFLALIPHISVLITSVSKDWFMTALPEHYTLDYYRSIFQQELSLVGIKNSLLYSGLSTFVDLILGLSIAYIISRKLLPFPGLLDSLVMVPLALPGIVLAFGYVVTYSDTFLDPMQNPIPLLVIAYSIRRLPYMVRSASAGLQQLSQTLEEASATMGASRFYTLRKITVPLVTANLIAGALLCFAYAMLDVSDSLILAMKDKYYPMTKAIYALFLEQFSGEFTASALGMVAMLILTTCIVAASLLLGKKMGELFRT